jgi:D-alanine-D-alanine ligase
MTQGDLPTDLPSRRVLVLYNEPVLPPNHPDFDSENEVLDTVEQVEGTLREAGYQTTRLGVGRDPEALFAGVRKCRPDVVFNLFEGTGDQGYTESYLAGILDWLGLPFTGSPAHTLCLARHKHLTKQLLAGAGLPTPKFFVVEELPIPACPIDWPVIVKPALQDASVGLDQGSVVTDLDSLEKRVAYLLRQYGPPVLVEEFIRGREFNVALVECPGLLVLPVSEILFKEPVPGYWPIVTYDAKWKPGTVDYEATPPVAVAKVPRKLNERLQSLAHQAFRLLGCRDYGRIDFRVTARGKPYILEVNPNPDFNPSAGFTGSLLAAGHSHHRFTLEMVANALERGKLKEQG